MTNYQEFAAASNTFAHAALDGAGLTGIALIVCGGQGVYSRVFRVVRLPKEQFTRETRGGSPSDELCAYARRKGLEAGFHPGNTFDAVPVVWMLGQAYAWPCMT